MTFNDLPDIRITKINYNIASCHIEDIILVKNNWAGTIITKEYKFIWGIFIRINKKTNTCKFKTDDISLELLQDGEVYKYLDAWNSNYAQIILSDKNTWIQEIFKVSDAYIIQSNGWKKYDKTTDLDENKVIKGRWNHEHCKLCMKKIDPESSICYFNNIDYVCPNCFENRIVKQELGDMHLTIAST